MSDNAKKFKIFGEELSWFYVKTKAKYLLRRFAYSYLVQELICTALSAYMYLVFFTSKKTFINDKKAIEVVRKQSPIILSFWHNRLMMVPFLANRILNGVKKERPNFRFMTLASKHGDGRFVGRVMEKFNFISILGSSQSNRKVKTRGIDLKALRQIFNGFKNGNSLGMTPDGPRGPNQQINGEIINIAKISGAQIFPVSYSVSKFIELNTWDKFKIPLPFSTLSFYCGEPIIVARDTSEDEMAKLKILLKERMDLAQKNSIPK